MERAASTGLVFKNNSIPDADDAVAGRVHISRSGIFKYLPGIDRSVGIYDDEAVHETVRARVQSSDYGPKGLRDSRFWAELTAVAAGGSDGAD
jgi:hypothetical protein